MAFDLEFLDAQDQARADGLVFRMSGRLDRLRVKVALDEKWDRIHRSIAEKKSRGRHGRKLAQYQHRLKSGDEIEAIELNREALKGTDTIIWVSKVPATIWALHLLDSGRSAAEVVSDSLIEGELDLDAVRALETERPKTAELDRLLNAEPAEEDQASGRMLARLLEDDDFVSGVVALREIIKRADSVDVEAVAKNSSAGSDSSTAGPGSAKAIDISTRKPSQKVRSTASG